MATNCIDMTGQRFGRLTVVERSPRKDSHASWWICKCDCGNTKEVRRACLVKGETKSCGCLNSELSKKRMTKNMTKHGYYGTRLYRIWHQMKDRCYNRNAKHYSDYGGRGIRICDEWVDNPKAFIEWSLSHGYSDELTIDRTDNDKGYSPDNCRWVTGAKQQTNKRNNVMITFLGKTQCVAEWARELHINQQLIYGRIKRGWTNPTEIFYGRKEINNGNIV